MNKNPYLAVSPLDLEAMLKSIGAERLDDLFKHIPDSVKSAPGLNLPAARSEMEIERHVKELALKNAGVSDALSFLGGGCYQHYIPSVVKHLASRAEFLTSYTPYQPEASQGSLQVFFEYQSLICRLYNLPVSNASLYDGASALAEAAFLALSQQAPRNRIIISKTVHPEYAATLHTYLKNADAHIETAPPEKGATSVNYLTKMLSDNADSIAAVIIQSPNFFGNIEETHEISRAAHDVGALLITIADPISLGILSPPGDYDADIAVAEGQPLGLDTYCGGENLGIFACKQDFLKKVPGRIIGMTKDGEGKRSFVLTLQTREQHIRREKATSNICSNQALNALKAAIYLSTLGPEGLKQTAQICADAVQYLKDKLSGIEDIIIPFPRPSFREFVIKLNRGCVKELIEYSSAKKIYPGIDLERFLPELKNHLLICITETKSKDDADALIDIINEYLERKA